MYCDAVNASHVGTRFRDFAGAPPNFRPLCVETRFFFGIDSLWKNRMRRAPADLRFDTSKTTPRDEAAALEALRARQRLALTPLRAARLVARLLPEKGAVRSTHEFAIHDKDELLDMLATIAFDHATLENGHKVRWTVKSSRRKDGLQPEHIARDEQMEWRVDRFELQRTS
jgi:hypothetical protein